MIAPFPEAVRLASRAFTSGVGVSSEFRPALMKVWLDRLGAELEAADTPDDAIARIESLKTEYLATEMRPRQYKGLLMLWSAVVLVGAPLVYLIFGEHSLMHLLEDRVPFCREFVGHFYSYIAFRYAMYGVLLGFALRISFDESRTSFGKERTVLSRPVLGLIVGSVLAYTLSRLVAEGKLELNILGVLLQRNETNLLHPVFHDSAALLLLGLLSGLASDVLLERLVGKSRSAAEAAFGE